MDLKRIENSSLKINLKKIFQDWFRKNATWHETEPWRHPSRLAQPNEMGLHGVHYREPGPGDRKILIWHVIS